MNQWAAFKARNPNAKLVCIDLQPYATTQAAEREDVLNIGGFSDHVFDVIAEFAKGTLNTRSLGRRDREGVFVTKCFYPSARRKPRWRFDEKFGPNAGRDYIFPCRVSPNLNLSAR